MIKIDFTLILTAINFAFLYFCLKKLLFNPLLSFMDKRDNEIEDALKVCRETEEKVESIKNTYSLKIQEGKVEAEKIISISMQKAWTAKKEKLDSVHNEKQSVINTEKEKLKESKQILNEKLKDEYEKYAVQVAEKILGKSVK